MVKRNNLSILLGLSLLLGSCQWQQDSGMDPDAGPEPSVEVEMPDNSPVSFALIALEDNGAIGELVGCGDSAILLTTEIPESSNNFTAERIKQGLEALFVLSESTYGETDLYNALYQSDLAVSSVTIKESLPEQIDIALTGTTATGGVCDDPRFVAQIQETAEANAPEGAIVSVTINGEALETYFDMSGQN